MTSDNALSSVTVTECFRELPARLTSTQGIGKSTYMVTCILVVKVSC